MSSKNYPLRDSGIYHNLPQFDPSIKDLTAIVTGANGISGFHTMRALLDSPQRWAKVYCLSRRPPPAEMLNLLKPEQRSRVHHIASDFLSEPEKIAEALKNGNVKADYIFFYSYLQPRPEPGASAWSNAEELVKVNKALLDNFLKALPLAGIKPKRFLLQTGAKNYGLHIGRARMPAIESDPRPTLEPNFYYPQEDALFEYCKKENVGWNVIRPSWILGAVHNAQMNALHPFAIYAAVCAQRNQPLVYPGDWSSWQADQHHATAFLTGYLSEWAVLEDQCANQAFNSQDTSPISFDRQWQELARWYGVDKGPVGPQDDSSNFLSITGKAGKDTPMGYGPAPVHKFAFSMRSWADDAANKAAWKEIMAANPSMTQNPFDDPDNYFTWSDAAYMMPVGPLSMNKARRLGWTGFVDTIEALFEMYYEMALLGMLPPMKVKEPKPMV